MKLFLTLTLCFFLAAVNASFIWKGKGCHLAVRINGKAYFVDGTTIDEHGDAHASDGFCEAIKKAEVQGEVVGGRFKVTYFKLIKPTKEKSATGS